MGKKRPNTIRTTISVPRELKGRMDKVKEGVNWSALACQAFQTKLAELKDTEHNPAWDPAVTKNAKTAFGQLVRALQSLGVKLQEIDNTLKE